MITHHLKQLRTVANAGKLWKLESGTIIASATIRIGNSFQTQTLTTSPATDNLPGLSLEQIGKIEKANEQLRYRHVEIEAALDPQAKDDARRRRMIYRSKQRGWLEADILMGSWATKNVPILSKQELDEYEIILNEETIDIFNYITGKDPLPDHLAKLSLMSKLQNYTYGLKLYTPADYSNVKKTTNLT